jgi:recombination associated protein RdgC
VFFKNLRLYQLGTEFNPDALELEAALAARPARPCGSLEAASMGWCPPVDGTLLFARQMQGATIICLKIEEKILPKAAVDKVLWDRVKKIESESNRIVRRKERDTLRDEIMQDLLPRALTKEEKIYAYIDQVNHLIVVDTASPKKAEALLTLLRLSVGSLPAIPMMGTVNHGMVLTDWMRGEAPPNFTVNQDTVLRGEDDKVSLSGVDLSSKEPRPISTPAWSWSV